MAHYFLGNALRTVGRTEEGIRHYREALRIRPDWPALLNSTAWLLSTHPDSGIREPDEAVRLAERAVELTMNRDPYYLDTLAAAYAATGQFERAVETAEEALALASRLGADALVEEIRSALASYRQSKPHRQPEPDRERD
jgi:tetratricopeptide (TPR) repeat protein